MDAGLSTICGWLVDVKALVSVVMGVCLACVPAVAWAADSGRPNPHVETGGGPDGIGTFIDGHGRADKPGSNSAPRPTDPYEIPPLPCFGLAPWGPGPCPTTPAAPPAPTLTDTQLRDLVPWPTATIVFTPGDRRGLVGLRMGMYATGSGTVGVAVVDPVTGTSVTGTGTALAWTWHPGDETEPSLAIAATTPGSPQAPSAHHAWPTRGIKPVAVVVSWEADLTVAYPEGTVEARHIGPVPVTSTRPFHLFEVQALISDSE